MSQHQYFHGRRPHWSCSADVGVAGRLTRIEHQALCLPGRSLAKTQVDVGFRGLLTLKEDMETIRPFYQGMNELGHHTMHEG